jgi:hypothetical protein
MPPSNSNFCDLNTPVGRGMGMEKVVDKVANDIVRVLGGKNI